VIKTFIVDPPTCFFIGLIFGYGVPEGHTGPVLKTKAFNLGLLFHTLYVGLCAYCVYGGSGEWMLMYLVRMESRK